MRTSQQKFLRDAAKKLGMTQTGFAERMGAPWTTFGKWLLPDESPNSREMPEIAWQLVREILAHEKLKSQRAKKD
jgi:DNA-binding transcriptional regulator YiaG